MVFFSFVSGKVGETAKNMRRNGDKHVEQSYFSFKKCKTMGCKIIPVSVFGCDTADRLYPFIGTVTVLPCDNVTGKCVSCSVAYETEPHCCRHGGLQYRFVGNGGISLSQQHVPHVILRTACVSENDTDFLSHVGRRKNAYLIGKPMERLPK